MYWDITYFTNIFFQNVIYSRVAVSFRHFYLFIYLPNLATCTETNCIKYFTFRVFEKGTRFYKFFLQSLDFKFNSICGISGILERLTDMQNVNKYLKLNINLIANC